MGNYQHCFGVSPLLASFLLATSCGPGNLQESPRAPPKAVADTAAAYTVGGSVTGLAGAQMLLWNTSPAGMDGLSLLGDGPFTFAIALVDGSTYEVRVVTRSTLICDVAKGRGTISGANVTDVAVTCTPAPITCGGFFPGNCVVDDLTGLLSGECWSVEGWSAAPSCFCQAGGAPNPPLVSATSGPTIDSSWCSI